jgi:hypothetical protein
MALSHDEATANLSIDGLAICCFNKSDAQWEVAYLHHPLHSHSLVLNIDGHPQAPLELPPDFNVISIKVTGKSPYGEFPKGFFGKNDPIANRKKRPKNIDEAENFRWAIDLEEPTADMGHGRGKLQPPRLNGERFPVSRAFIEKAVFYTQTLPQKNLSRLFVGEHGATMPQQEFKKRKFGRTNNVIGADITGELIEIVIVLGNGERIVLDPPLGHRVDDPWQISLTNMRPDGIAFHSESQKNEHSHGGSSELRSSMPGKGDFDLYYTAFKLNEIAEQRALWGFPEVAAFRSGRTDCNAVWLGTSTDLAKLFE